MKLSKFTAKAGLLAAVFFFWVAVLAAGETQRAVVFQTLTIEGFDDPETSHWIVRGSKFATAGFPRKQFVNAYPTAVFGKNHPDGDNLNSLGIYGKFDRKGYNYIEIIPARVQQTGCLTPEPLPIPGQVTRIDVWAWGSNYDYYMEIHLQDHRGVTHNLFLGTLNYVGWQNLSVSVPGSIPQEADHVPRQRSLLITKLVLWTRPHENVDGFYFYIDELKVLTDIFKYNFDGDLLVTPQTIGEVWESSETEGESE